MYASFIRPIDVSYSLDKEDPIELCKSPGSEVRIHSRLGLRTPEPDHICLALLFVIQQNLLFSLSDFISDMSSSVRPSVVSLSVCRL